MPPRVTLAPTQRVDHRVRARDHRCILGGVSRYGGVGTIGQVVGGTMALAVLVDGMTLLNISPYYQTVLEGAVLVTVVTVAALVHTNVMTRVWLASVVARVRTAWAYSHTERPAVGK